MSPRGARRRAYVYPVTLTGLGERVHLGGPHVDLDTHIADVVNLLRFEELHQATLVGHSYAALVITGAADQVPERIARLIYVERPLPDGVAHLDLNPPEVRQAQEQQVATEGQGWRLPMPPWEELDQGNDLRGLGEAERQRMRARAVDQPFGTLTQPVRLQNPARDALPKTVIWSSLTVEEVQGLIDLIRRFAASCPNRAGRLLTAYRSLADVLATGRSCRSAGKPGLSPGCPACNRPTGSLRRRSD